MSDLFTITPAIRLLAQGAIDSMINQLGKTCRLVFESPQLECTNCHFDPGSRRSAGVYNGTGPRPFTKPPCPVCKGVGLIGTPETFLDVLFLIDWQPKMWGFVGTSEIKTPEGMVQAKGYVQFLPQVLQCRYMVIDPEHAVYEKNKFVLFGEPTPQGNIVANRYFISTWSRYQG